MDKISPPKYALVLFRWYCRPDRVEELEGDLTELYEIRASRKETKNWIVDLQFWWDVIRCFKSYSRKRKYLMDTSGALYKSYVKLAFRQMHKNKGPIIINVLGLGLALGFCMTVYMIYAYNWEFDSVYNSDNIFRIHGIKDEEGEKRHHESTPLPLEIALETDLASVEDVVSYCAENGIIKNGDQFISEYVAFASPGFLSLFELPLKYGTKKDLSNPNGLYITEELSEKMYGPGSPVGEIMTIYLNNNAKVDATILGVFEKIPLNSSFLFSALLSAEKYISSYDMDRNDWSNESTFAQYVKLTSADNVASVDDHLRKYIPLQNEGVEHFKLEKFELIPFRDPIINDGDLYTRHTNSRMRLESKLIFTVMGVLILFIASFNMANTTMALISKRVKEIGVRKTLGSFNHQIFIQFLFEMLITMALAFIVALAMTNIMAREIWGLFGVKFFLQDIDLVGVSFFVAAFLLFCTLITGLFPALYAWKFQPVSILSHKQSLKGVGVLHKILTVAQYSFSITVLVAGIAFSQNVDFLKTMDYGYDIDNTLILEIDDRNEFVTLKEKIDKLSFVESSFGSHHNLAGVSGRELLEIDTLKNEVTSYKVGSHLLSQMEVRFQKGRNFYVGSENDVSKSIIVNRRFTDKYLNNTEALNKVVKIAGNRKTIIGIIDDYLDAEVFSDYKQEPIVFNMVSDTSYKKLIVKTTGIDQKEAESAISAIWANTIDRPFIRRWQDDIAQGGSAKASNQLRTLFLWLAGLGCVLSLIGIMSLASLNVVKKTKEISIRKVLGASLNQIILSINKPFFKILGLSLVFGVILGWFVTDSILSAIYLYYIDVSPITGIPVGLFIVIAALIITSIAVLRAAMSSPSEGLRSE